MFDIGFTEMTLVAVIALVVLGPERLPQVARKIGGFLGQSRRMFFKFQEELTKETSDLGKSVKTHMSAFEETVKKTEKEMHSVFSFDKSADSAEISDTNKTTIDASAEE